VNAREVILRVEGTKPNNTCIFLKRLYKMSLHYKTPDLRGNLQNASTKVSLYKVFVVVTG
jgi:hypothetical protein